MKAVVVAGVLLAGGARVAHRGGPASCDGRTATVIGASGNDDLVGTPGPDVIAGLGGDDVLCGGDGADWLRGGDDRDLLDGGAGGTPDEQHQSTKTVNVNGVDCQIAIDSERYIDMVSAASGAEEQGVDVNGSGAADLLRTTHVVGFVNGPSVSYTMASK